MWCLLVFSNFKGLIEFEMGFFVVVNKVRGNMVCVFDEYVVWGCFFLDCWVGWLVLCFIFFKKKRK